MKKAITAVCVMVSFYLVITAVSEAADKPENKETFGQKTKNFIQKLFSYPADVVQGSVDVVADTGKRGTAVVTEEVKTVGQVITGDVDKTKELITEPLTGTAETLVKTVEEAGKVPVEAANESD